MLTVIEKSNLKNACFEILIEKSRNGPEDQSLVRVMCSVHPSVGGEFCPSQAHISSPANENGEPQPPLLSGPPTLPALSLLHQNYNQEEGEIPASEMRAQEHK